MSFSAYSVYSSLLYFILHSPLSFVAQKMALKIFLSKTPKLASSDLDSTHVSELYAICHIKYIAENYQLLKTRFAITTSIISFNPQFQSLSVASIMSNHRTGLSR